MLGTLLIPSVVLAVFIAADLGCTTVGAPERVAADTTEESGSAAQPEGSLTGVWEGGSVCRGGRWGFSCRGIRNIAFTILPLNPTKTKGFYRCATGTVSCRNRLETGAIARIDLDGRRLWLRVMLGDGSSCLYTSLLAHGRLRGGYECLQGAGLVEQGSWWVERSY